MKGRRRGGRIGAGRRSVEKEEYQWGADERKRMADMAAWTREHSGREAENPHTREKRYPPEVHAQAARFEDWHKAHPNRPHHENPHRRIGRALRAIEINTRLSEAEVEEGERQDKRAKFRIRNKSIIERRKYRDNHTCQACGFSLTVNHVRVIDCHHLNPLGSSETASITKVEDLVCLCPTCHRIAHTRKPPLTVDEIRNELLRGGTLGNWEKVIPANAQGVNPNSRPAKGSNNVNRQIAEAEAKLADCIEANPLYVKLQKRIAELKAKLASNTAR
jgi:hypothetical protein